MHLLIDGDVIVYRAVARVDDYLMAVERVDNQLLGVISRFDGGVEGSCTYDIYLSDTSNYRYGLATIQPYKGNRPSAKPPQYRNIREYLKEYWGAVVVPGLEADDAIGLNYRHDSCIVSVDKDFKTLPNVRFYDLNTHNLVYVDEDTAWLNYFVQMLVGDKADNIPGVKNPFKKHWSKPPNFTDQTARQYLTGLSVDQMFRFVCGAYQAHYGDQWREAFTEVSTLLWIQRPTAIKPEWNL